MPQGKPEGFRGVIWNLKRTCVTFNPSVCSRCSQPAPDGSPSPLSLRDISPHRGESPFTREPNLIPQSTHFVRRQLLTGESPLCRSATFPHTVGNHPFQGSLNKSLSLLTSFADSSLFKGAYLSPLFLPENTVKMFKTVFNTCQKVQNSKTLTICS